MHRQLFGLRTLVTAEADSSNLYFEAVPTQVMSTTIIQLEEVLYIHLVNSLHYSICLDQISLNLLFTRDVVCNNASLSE